MTSDRSTTISELFSETRASLDRAEPLLGHVDHEVEIEVALLADVAEKLAGRLSRLAGNMEPLF